MAKCTARCYWIEYEAKQPDHFTYSINVKTTQDIPGDLMPSTDEFSSVIQGVIDEYNGRDLIEQGGACEEGCNWEMLDTEGAPWTPWRKVAFRRTLTKEEGGRRVEFDVTGELEVRKRLLGGVCIEREL